MKFIKSWKSENEGQNIPTFCRMLEYCLILRSQKEGKTTFRKGKKKSGKIN